MKKEKSFIEFLDYPIIGPILWLSIIIGGSIILTAIQIFEWVIKKRDGEDP